MTLADALPNFLYESRVGKAFNPNVFAHQLTNAEKLHHVEKRRCRQAQYPELSILPKNSFVVFTSHGWFGKSLNTNYVSFEHTAPYHRFWGTWHLYDSVRVLLAPGSSITLVDNSLMRTEHSYVSRMEPGRFDRFLIQNEYAMHKEPGKKKLSREIVGENLFCTKISTAFHVKPFVMLIVESSVQN